MNTFDHKKVCQFVFLLCRWTKRQWITYARNYSSLRRIAGQIFRKCRFINNFNSILCWFNQIFCHRYASLILSLTLKRPISYWMNYWLVAKCKKLLRKMCWKQLPLRIIYKRSVRLTTLMICNVPFNRNS